MMQEHQKYTNHFNESWGKYSFSSLKSDMSSSITVIKSRNETEIQEFYKHEPLFNNNVLSYHISELQIHYHTSETANWF